MSFEDKFKAAFDNGLTDIKFFVRRSGEVVTVDKLKCDALAFQNAIVNGDVEPVDSVD